MRLVTTEEMRRLEQRSVEAGVSLDMLMENAGLAVAEEVGKLRGGSVAGCPIVILCGPGNNGGDGLVAARHLYEWDAEVSLFLYKRRTEDDKNYKLLQERGFSSVDIEKDEGMSRLKEALASSEIVIDALFGTGTLRPLQGAIRELAEQVRKAKQSRPQLMVVALDLPSGLDADSGAIDPACLTADVTITLGYPKVGLFSFPGAERVGRLIVADIGIPRNLAEDIKTGLITSEWVRSVLPRRPLDANKGSFGKVLASAGSVNYIGAAYLACAAATRVGAGLVTLATARSLQPILATKLNEVTYAPLAEAEPGVVSAEVAPVFVEQLREYDVLLMGCGMGQHESTAKFIRDTLFSLAPIMPRGVVLDADALNALAKQNKWWQKMDYQAILTPHPGEMARLTGLTVTNVQAERLKIARGSAAEWGKVVVLKGAYTVIAAPDGRAKLNPSANPGLASAGTGDVLSGTIAGLLAQGLSPFDAACCGVYLHSMAGDAVKAELGDAGMVASDLLPVLPRAIRKLKGQ
ncbi:MAG: NAD(P)H-hydrate dehydratase [Chloroflexi bacterium]|nr:NAD(P)H-hydrate dehydratase [Chloroflexota bacterium]